jgi:photosystem II stability/assembly factor-like uncharacterized protein
MKRFTLTPILVLLCASLAAVASGGVNTWTGHGPAGRIVQVLAIDPRDSATLYAGTYGNGIYKSVDGGASWSAAGLSGALIRSLVIDPSSGAIYAGTQQEGVFKSANGAQSWIGSGLLQFFSVEVLVVDSSAPGTIYAGGSAGAFKSTDGGGSWIAINAGLTGGDVRAFAIDPSTPATLYAAANGILYKSVNRGGTWTSIAGLATSLFVQALILDPSTPATIYAGGTDRRAGGVRAFKSTNGGDTWNSSDTGLTGSWVWKFAVDRSSPTTLYAGTYDGVFKSTNAGDSWTGMSAGLTATFVQTLAIDPSRTGTLYAGTFVGGVFKTSNGGATWEGKNSGLNSSVSSVAVDPSSSHTVYAGTNSYGGVYKSANDGESWTAVTPALDLYIEALVIDPSKPATLYAGTASYDYPGFFKSTDGGANWRQRLDARVFGLVMDPSESDTLYAGTLFPSGVFKSIDGGESWTSTNAGLDLGSADAGVGALAVDRSAPSTVYAGVFGKGSGGLFKSMDAGQSWTAINSGVTVKDIRALAIDPSTPRIVYAGTSGGGVFKTIDGAESWAESSTGLTDRRVVALAVDPRKSTTVYAGTAGGGVFRSTNSGETWSAFNGGLGNLVVNALAMDSATSRLYAATDGGVYDYLATPSPCVSDATTLCLAGRFQFRTEWTTAAGQSGSGRVLAVAGGDTGYFTFFGADNVEVAVKVLNGCSANGNFWVFAGGLTDLAVTLTVTDTETGTVRSYTNPRGTPFRPIQDTSSFASCATGTPRGARAHGGSAVSLVPPQVTGTFSSRAAAPCVPDPATLCLGNSRYKVRARWIDWGGYGEWFEEKDAGAVRLTGDTGAFWFFGPGNIELVIKVLDGCGTNSHAWVFAAGLTDVQMIVTVTDTRTGVVRTYTNPQGTAFEPIQDTNAFATCP